MNPEVLSVPQLEKRKATARDIADLHQKIAEYQAHIHHPDIEAVNNILGEEEAKERDIDLAKSREGALAAAEIILAHEQGWRTSVESLRTKPGMENADGSVNERNMENVDALLQEIADLKERAQFVHDFAQGGFAVN